MYICIIYNISLWTKIWLFIDLLELKPEIMKLTNSFEILFPETHTDFEKACYTTQSNRKISMIMILLTLRYSNKIIIIKEKLN